MKKRLLVGVLALGLLGCQQPTSGPTTAQINVETEGTINLRPTYVGTVRGYRVYRYTLTDGTYTYATNAAINNPFITPIR